ncbi:hypothetical protein RHMOL_Rhmol07G0244100 [Rhododendron molle]|uniref:Uncharacterized protein n=1 Tax=Rhododendron molle TaxID=49168 RepID=A0ACC0N5R6_RHOML|nr:hypothetical protein RHMOL_Rhmol07G0244100 [Rhododendron molle]
MWAVWTINKKRCGCRRVEELRVLATRAEVVAVGGKHLTTELAPPRVIRQVGASIECFLMTFNLIGNLMFSKDLLDPNSGIGGEFFFHTGKVLELVAKPNYADFLPILRRFDPQGIRRKTQFQLERVLEITRGFIRVRIEARGGDCEEEERSRDYMDVLLERRDDGVEGPLCYSSASINVTVLVSASCSIYEHGVEPSEMDMSEHMGAMLKKAIPLKALAIPYKG